MHCYHLEVLLTLILNLSSCNWSPLFHSTHLPFFLAPFSYLLKKSERTVYSFPRQKTLMNLKTYISSHLQCDISLFLNSQIFWLSFNLWPKTNSEPFYRTILELCSCKLLWYIILNFNASEEERGQKSCTLQKSSPWRSGWETLIGF